MMHSMASWDGTAARCSCGEHFPNIGALVKHMEDSTQQEPEPGFMIHLDRIERQMVIDALETCTADWDNTMEQIAMRLIARLREGQ